MITVITITYNNYEELLSTLDSLSSALIPGKIESLVINGGQCQKTRDYLSTYSGDSISEPDNGISDAFNKGIKNANGDFVVVLNSGDTLINQKYYSEALSILNSNKGVAFVYGKGVMAHRNFGKMLVIPEPDKILEKNPFFHASMVIRKSMFEKYGYYNPKYKIAMDYDFILRLHKNNERGHYLDLDPCVLMDGTGVSSSYGHTAINEAITMLKSYDLFTYETRRKFMVLKLKNNLRDFLYYLRLLKSYDQYKAYVYKKRN